MNFGCGPGQTAGPAQSVHTPAIENIRQGLPPTNFGYLPVECPCNEFHEIDCRLKLGAELLDRLFHRRRNVSPSVNNAAHRFFDGSQHVLCCNFAVGSRHSAVPQFPNGVVSSVSFVSSTNTARSLAGCVSLALA
jgi:hypothetical protein